MPSSRTHITVNTHRTPCTLHKPSQCVSAIRSPEACIYARAPHMPYRCPGPYHDTADYPTTRDLTLADFHLREYRRGTHIEWKSSAWCKACDLEAERYRRVQMTPDAREAYRARRAAYQRKYRAKQKAEIEELRATHDLLFNVPNPDTPQPDLPDQDSSEHSTQPE